MYSGYYPANNINTNSIINNMNEINNNINNNINSNINNINNNLGLYPNQIPNYNNNVYNAFPNMNPNSIINPNLFIYNNNMNSVSSNFINNNINYNYENNNNINLNDIYIYGDDPRERQNNNEINSTPTGEEYMNKKDKEDLEYYYKGLDEEKKKDEKITDYNKKKTELFFLDENSFSYNNFKKAPTTYIDNENINLTYMTCVIQCLANIEPIAKYYLKEKKNFAKNMNKFALNYAFSRIISNIYSYPEETEKQFYSNYKIDEFRNLVFEINGLFRGSSTKDANKFIIFLLEQLKEEQEQTLNSNNKQYNTNNNDNEDFKNYYKELLSQNNSLFFNCFSWIQKTVKICPYEHKTIELNNFLTYELDIVSHINCLEIENNSKPKENQTYEIRILDCLKNDFKSKKLYNLNCFKCKKKTDLDKNTSLVISPNYFIFLTGLRENLTNTYEKFKKSKENKDDDKYIFKIEEEIDLSEVIENKNSHMKYRLDGLISYNFDEIDKNKIYYIAYYRSPIDKSWYKYTEKLFGKVQVTDVLKSFENYYFFPSLFIYRHQ